MPRRRRSHKMHYAHRSLGSLGLLEAVSRTQLLVGVGVAAGLTWFLTRKAKAEALDSSSSKDSGSLPFKRMGIDSRIIRPESPIKKASDIRRTALVIGKSDSVVPKASGAKGQTGTSISTPVKTVSQSDTQTNSDPCAGLTGKAGLECRERQAFDDLNAAL